MVTKYPVGTMEGGLAAWKGVEEGRTNERKDEGNRASRVKREMEVTSGGAYNCSTTQLLVLRIARSGTPKCFSAVEIPLTLTVLPDVLERTSHLPRLPTPSCTWHGICASLCRGNQVSTLNVGSGASKIVDAEVLGIFSEQIEFQYVEWKQFCDVIDRLIWKS